MKPKIPQQIFKNESAATPQHDEMLLLFNKDSTRLTRLIFELNKQSLSEYVKDIVEETQLKKDTTGFHALSNGYIGDKVVSTTFKHEETKLYVSEWTPEKAIIKGRNNYYIGSVDLFVNYHLSLTHHSNIIEYNKQKCRLVKHTGIGGGIIFEFKPQIKSFSEVIRQVKVYESYMGGNKTVVVTYSDISIFKDVFKSQGIKLIQLKKDGTNDSQTNLG